MGHGEISVPVIEMLASGPIMCMTYETFNLHHSVLEHVVTVLNQGLAFCDI